MARRRGSRYTVRRRQAPSPTRKDRIQVTELYAGRASLTDEEVEHLTGEPTRRVQHEAAEAEHLALEAGRRWWAPGFRHHDTSRVSVIENTQRKERGAGRGWPDYTLHVPNHVMRTYYADRPLCAALELKRPDLRPKNVVADRWWLLPDVFARAGETHYGLSADQAIQLQILAACGYQTMVAYGAEEALAWLDEVAGPKPARDPFPRLAGEIDDWK